MLRMRLALLAFGLPGFGRSAALDGRRRCSAGLFRMLFGIFGRLAVPMAFLAGQFALDGFAVAFGRVLSRGHF